jgi:nucleoside-diphosphate-sugar epimerase
VEGDPARRGDPYVQSKLAQEELLRRRAASDGLALTILRPGVVFGPGNLWSDRIGIRLGERWWLRFTGAGPLPLCYVENCAEAIVRCAECAATIGETFNVVDGELPTRRRYVRALRSHLVPRPRVVPLPGIAARAAARVADGTARLLLGESARLPWFLSPARLGAQIGQQRTPNERLCAALGWRPRYGLAEALERSFEAPIPAATSLAEAAVE